MCWCKHLLSYTCRSKIGEMPLHLAAIRGSTEVARLLLEHGAELNPPLITDTEVIHPLAGYTHSHGYNTVPPDSGSLF